MRDADRRLEQVNALLEEVARVTGKLCRDGVVPWLELEKPGGCPRQYPILILPPSAGGEIWPINLNYTDHRDLFPHFVCSLSAYVREGIRLTPEDVRGDLRLGYSEGELELRRKIRDFGICTE